MDQDFVNLKKKLKLRTSSSCTIILSCDNNRKAYAVNFSYLAFYKEFNQSQNCFESGELLAEGCNFHLTSFLAETVTLKYKCTSKKLSAV